MDVGTQQLFVRGAASHHDLDGALRFGIGVVPVGRSATMASAEMDADFAAHRHHHPLPSWAWLRSSEVSDQIGCHLLDARRAAHHLSSAAQRDFELWPALPSSSSSASSATSSSMGQLLLLEGKL